MRRKSDVSRGHAVQWIIEFTIGALPSNVKDTGIVGFNHLDAVIWREMGWR